MAAYLVCSHPSVAEESQSMKSRQQGFTLVELMVTVAIVGILAGIAIPSYQDSVRKSRRADVKGILLNLANAMERHYTEANTYCDSADASGANNCGAVGTNDTGTPSASVFTIPPEITSFYEVTIDVATVSTYTLRARPIGAQANDRCDDLTLTHTGIKGNDAGLDQSVCW
jgi:type IV pilus assembly protein PilE